MRKIATPHLGIELTQLCNLDCRHCMRGNSRNVKISKEILEKVFDEIKLVEVLDLSGGEVFLAYNEFKMLLEIAKEKGTKIIYCSMLTNGTVYDERIYDLLEEYFPGRYQVAISDDDFHIKSIQRIYGNKKGQSQNSDLFPISIDDVNENTRKHFDKEHCIGFQRVSNHLIKNGRAINITYSPQKEFEAMGYYYNKFGKGLLAGPMIFIGAEGYISDINSDISKREEQSIGNINTISIAEAIEKCGIEVSVQKPQEFFDKMKERERDFATHKGEHWGFKDNHMEPTEYKPDTGYAKELEKSVKMFEDFKKVINSEKGVEGLIEFINGLDFNDYLKDISQVDHKYPQDEGK